MPRPAEGDDYHYEGWGDPEYTPGDGDDVNLPLSPESEAMIEKVFVEAFPSLQIHRPDALV